jgi:hypothetical protein
MLAVVVDQEVELVELAAEEQAVSNLMEFQVQITLAEAAAVDF